LCSTYSCCKQHFISIQNILSDHKQYSFSVLLLSLCVFTKKLIRYCIDNFKILRVNHFSCTLSLLNCNNTKCKLELNKFCPLWGGNPCSLITFKEWKVNTGMWLEWEDSTMMLLWLKGIVSRKFAILLLVSL
jgi:hypothetical protein